MSTKLEGQRLVHSQSCSTLLEKMPSLLSTVISLLFVVTSSSSLPSSLAQDVPDPRPGFVYRNGSSSTKLQLEMFSEVLCPYAKEALMIVKPLVDGYQGQDLRFTIYQFPLPYHQYGFLATQTLLLVKDFAYEKFIEYSDAIMAVQGNYSTGMVADLTWNEALEQFAEVAERVTGLSKEFVISNSSDYNFPARMEWKYGASRGVHGTPTIFLNGIEMIDFPESQEAWRKRLDEARDQKSVKKSVECALNTSPPSSFFNRSALTYLSTSLMIVLRLVCL